LAAHGRVGGVAGAATVITVVAWSSELSSPHDATQRQPRLLRLVLGDAALTIGSVSGGEAINVVTSKTPISQPIA
jgi:hypothetical protein